MKRMILLLLSFVLYLHLGSLFNCIASYHQSEPVTTLACLALQRLSSAWKSSFVATLMHLSPHKTLSSCCEFTFTLGLNAAFLCHILFADDKHLTDQPVWVSIKKRTNWSAAHTAVRRFTFIYHWPLHIFLGSVLLAAGAAACLDAWRLELNNHVTVVTTW